MKKEILNLKNILVQLVDFYLANLLPKNINNKFSLVDRLLPKKVVSEIIDHCI